MIRALAPCSLVLCLSLAGCTATMADVADEETGVVVAALGSAPAGVTCLRVRARGADGTLVADERLSVVAGDPAELLIDSLPEAPLTFRGDAYATSCASVDAARASWSSNDVVMRVDRHRAQTLELVLRPSRPTDVEIDFEANVVGVAFGNASVGAVFDDGTARGRGGFTYLLGSLSDLRDIAMGNHHVCVLRGTAGEVLCFGQNDRGQCGTGTTSPSITTPTRVSLPFPAVQIVAAGEHSCAVTSVGWLYCWGFDSDGQLGTSRGSIQPTPVNVASSIAEVATSQSHTCALQSHGSVMCAGANTSGQLGIGSTTMVTGFQIVPTVSGAASVAVSLGASYALLVDGTVRAWGSSARTYGNTPVAIGLPVRAEQIAAHVNGVCARGDGRLWCWGWNHSGAVGIGSPNATVPDPVEVLFASRVMAADMGASSTACATLDDGSLWCWGRNVNDILGLGTIESQWSPVQVSFAP